MAEKLSVISLSYQMVEGLINNFKSNKLESWPNTQTHMHTLLAAYAKSPAQEQMHIIYTCLLIHMALKSNRKAFIVLSVRLCTVPFSSLLRLLAQLPRLAVKAIVGVEGRCYGWVLGS